MLLTIEDEGNRLVITPDPEQVDEELRERFDTIFCRRFGGSWDGTSWEVSIK